MQEHSPDRPERQESEREQRRKEIVALTLELAHETFPFPGISEETLERLVRVDQQFPGLATPIAVLVERMRQEGIVVDLGKNPQSGNVFVLPSGSDDVENDSIPARYLQRDGIQNEKLRHVVDMVLGFTE